MLRVLFSVALALLSLHLQADSASTSRLGRLLENMRHFQADFHQALLDERGELVQESDGRVTVLHPGRFRWETSFPAKQLVVSDGTTVWQYDPDLMQAVRRPLDKRADQIPSLLLSGDIAAVSRLYEISKRAAGRNQEIFLLRPRDNSGLFTELTIRFDAGVPSSLDISDGMGQRTAVTFSGFERGGSKVDGKIFRFQPPIGVDVVNDE